MKRLSILGPLIASSTLAFAQADSPGACIAARRFVKTDQCYGQYMRVHPSGNYAMFTGSCLSNKADVYIVDLNSGKIIPTRLANEAYPVEPSWDLISSPYDYTGDKTSMKYFNFQELLKAGDDPKSVEPEFEDKVHDEYYQSTAELPGSTPTQRKIRTTLYSGQLTKEYSVTMDAAGNVTNKTSGEAYRLCEKMVGAAPFDEAKYQAAKAVYDGIVVQMTKIEEDYYAVRDRTDLTDDQKDAERKRLEVRYYALRDDKTIARAKMDEIKPPSDLQFYNPVLSKDGTRVSEISSGVAKIYKINDDNSCELIANTGFRTSKGTFSYPVAGQEPKYVATVEGSASEDYKKTVMIFDPNTGKSVALPDTPGSYPGFTKDGRIIYHKAAGIEIVDPNQLLGDTAHCIKNSDVAAVQDEGAADAAK